MKGKFSKIAVFVATVILVSSSYIVGLHAQQSSTTPAMPAKTNWTGYLVVGRNDASDAIAIGGPHPTVSHQVEIGLRSDGIVVWRRVSKQ